MVAVTALEFLDKANVKKFLFDHGADNENLPHTEFFAFISEPSEPVVLYFPAEFDNFDTIRLLGQGIKRCGFSFIPFEYKEFGLNKGTFSFKEVFSEADFFVSSLLEWKKAEEIDGPLVIMGRSFGSALAIDQALKRQNDILCLVLESAFASSRVFLERSGVNPSLIPQGPIFQNREKMSKLKPPVLFIHSPRDTVQSLSELEWLVMESRSKATQLQIAPSGTRQELATQVGPLYFDFFKQYVNLRRGIRPPRKKRKRQISRS